MTITAANNNVDAPDKSVSVSATASNSHGITAPSNRTLTITDDEAAPTATLVLSSTSISENGGSSTVTATLNHASSAATTLTVSAPASSDWSLSTNKTLTIAAGATSSTGTVTITAANNNIDAPDKSVSVSASASNSHGVTAPSGQTLTITDDDPTPTASLSLSSTSIAENGGSSTVTAALDRPSGASTTLTVSVPSSSDYSLSANRTLTVAAGATSSTGTVTITANDDDIDTPDKSVTVSATASNSHAVTAPTDRTLTITDDDVAGVTVSKTAVTVTEIDDPATGGKEHQATYTVVLHTQPTGSATVTPSVSGDVATVSPASLAFTAGTWSTARTVTVTAVNDDIDNTGDRRTATLGHSVSNYHSTVTTAASVAVTVNDDDTFDVTISPTTMWMWEHATALGRAGAKKTEATYTVTLHAEPKSPATVTPSVTGSAAAVSGALTFTAQDWGAKRVTVSGVHDNTENSGGLRTATIANGLAGDADDILGVTVDAVTATVYDNDTPPGATITPTTLEVAEADNPATTSKEHQATFTVKLNRPIADGYIAFFPGHRLSPDDGTLVSRYDQLNFNQDDWNVPQTVTVTALDDDFDNPGDKRVVTFTHASAVGPGGQEYDQGQVPDLTYPTVTVTVTDDDTAGVTVSTTSVTVAEADDSTTPGVREHEATYTVVLNSRPTGHVTVAAASSATGHARVSPASLTFSGSTWSTAQTVTVTGVNDDLYVPRTATLTHSVTGYGTVTTAASVAVAVPTDDPRVRLSATALEVTEVDDPDTPGVKENEAIYTVELDSQPRSAATVTASVSGGAVTVSAPLTFTAQDWEAAKTVTVTAVDDDLPGARTATLTHAVTGYGTVTTAASVTVTVPNDDPGVTLSRLALEVAESGGAAATRATYTMELDTPPEGTVTVTPFVAPGSAARVASAPLSFTAQNWDVPQAATVAGVDDALDNPGDRRAATVMHRVAGYGSVTSASSVSVTVHDDTDPSTPRPPGLTLAPGESGTYEIRLNKRPGETGAYVIPSEDPAGTTVRPSVLEISAATWDTWRRITISVASDYDPSLGFSRLIGHHARDNAGVVPLAIEDFTLTIPDIPGVEVTPRAVTVAEADDPETEEVREHEATYAVVLNTDPGAGATVRVTVASDAVDTATVRPASLVFTTGTWSTAQMVTVSGQDDDIDNPTDRGATLTHAVTGYGDVRTAASVTVTVRDDEGLPPPPPPLPPPPPGTLSVTIAGGAAVTEGATALFTLSTSAAPASDLAVGVRVAEGPGGDFVAPEEEGPRTVTIAAGETSALLRVPTVADLMEEPHGAVIVTLEGGAGYALGAATSAAVTVRDDDGSEPVSETGWRVPYLPSGSGAHGTGFVRVINHSAAAGSATLTAYDDAGTAYGPLALHLEARAAVQLTSEDIEAGNPRKGLDDGTGAGEGDWRLELASPLDLEVLSYSRSADGFVTSLHDVAPRTAAGAHRVVFMNPGSNRHQVSRLRLVNPGESAAEVRITGVDDAGAPGAGAVALTLGAGASRTLRMQALESGEGEGLSGALGDGAGKWRLEVSADRAIRVMSLLASPTGHLANVSTAPERPGAP